MTLAADLLKIARAPLPDSGHECRAALAEAEDALASLDTGRDQLQADINTALAQRRELLLDEAPEAQRRLAALSGANEAAQLEIERLDEIESLLIDRCHHLDRRAKQHDAEGIRNRYAAAVDEWARATAAATDARAALIAIREEAIGAGMEGQLGVLELPVVQFPQDFGAINRFRVGVRQSLMAVKGAPPRQAVYPIRVVQRIEGAPYNVGETIGLDAAVAWQWVDAGCGAWADPKRRPPKPAGR